MVKAVKNQKHFSNRLLKAKHQATPPESTCLLQFASITVLYQIVCSGFAACYDGIAAKLKTKLGKAGKTVETEVLQPLKDQIMSNFFLDDTEKELIKYQDLFGYHFYCKCLLRMSAPSNTSLFMCGGPKSAPKIEGATVSAQPLQLSRIDGAVSPNPRISRKVGKKPNHATEAVQSALKIVRKVGTETKVVTKAVQPENCSERQQKAQSCSKNVSG